MKTIKEVTKKKRGRPVKKVLTCEEPTPIYFSEMTWSTKKPKVIYTRDIIVALCSILAVALGMWLITLEAGTLKTCYEIWQSVN